MAAAIAGEIDVADRVAAAVAALGPVAEIHAPLAPFTTYRVGGAAAVLARPRSRADVER
ncbi:MAG: hypothetical protein H0U21_03455, partial [Acidimicrobiia bacterium]|nr:hypothetical protein [Acidimicrobiia bacterium]